jgi:hypothetical protein
MGIKEALEHPRREGSVTPAPLASDGDPSGLLIGSGGHDAEF